MAISWLWVCFCRFDLAFRLLDRHSVWSDVMLTAQRRGWCGSFKHCTIGLRGEWVAPKGCFTVGNECIFLLAAACFMVVFLFYSVGKAIVNATTNHEWHTTLVVLPKLRRKVLSHGCQGHSLVVAPFTCFFSAKTGLQRNQAEPCASFRLPSKGSKYICKCGLAILRQS